VTEGKASVTGGKASITALHFGLDAGTDFSVKTKQDESKQRLAAMQIKLSLSTSASPPIRR
jgi:hypothetical protein